MKKRILFIKFVACLLCCFILSTPLTISAVDYSCNDRGQVVAGDPQSGRIYVILVSSTKAFDVINALTADNSPVWTYTYNGDACQEWTFLHQGNSVYAIQDTNSGKYLTVKDDSSSLNAEVVITSKPSGGFSSGQLFKVEQIGTANYKLLSKCSNYTYAIGTNSSGYLRQTAKTNVLTNVYLDEAGYHHGFLDGDIHLQMYNTSYSVNDKMLGFVSSTTSLTYSKFSNSATFEWYIRYAGNGYFTLKQDGCSIYTSGSTVNKAVSVSSTAASSQCMWKVIEGDGYYQLAPKAAVSGDTASVVLGISGTSPKLVSSSSSTGKWRIIQSHYYDNRDLTIYAAEDFGHSSNYSSHADIFQYACSSLYLRGKDNQKLIFTTGELEWDTDEITELLQQTNIFVLRAHGSATSFLMNARDGNGNNIDTTTRYNLSNITGLNSSLSSLKCAIFISCHSAEGAYTSGSSASNFVTAIVGKGAKCAIGFDGEVNCQKASSFASAFFEYFYQNYGADDSVASDAFNYAVTITQSSYSTSDYQPLFYNGYTIQKLPLS